MTVPSSANVHGPRLLFGLLLRLGSGRKLQHCRILTFLKLGQKNLLTVWHFKDIVMNIRLVLVLLPEDSGREPALDAVAFARDPTKPDGFVESKLGAGNDTNRRCVTDRIVNRFESNSAASEIVAYQFVGHDCGAGLGVLKTEVAHGQKPLSWFGLSASSESPLANHTPDHGLALSDTLKKEPRHTGSAQRGGGSSKMKMKPEC